MKRLIAICCFGLALSTLGSAHAADTTVPALTNALLVGGTPASGQAAFPSGDFQKVTITFSDAPTCDPWDRLFGVLVDGVEVLRGTTPRTAFTVTEDVTAYRNLLSGTRTVTVHLDNYHDGSEPCSDPDYTHHTASVAFTFSGAPAPAGLAKTFAAPFAYDFLAPVPDDYQCQNLQPTIDASRPVALPSGAITKATLYVYASGHDCEEDWFIHPTPAPVRVTHVFLDGDEIATYVPLPYTYAFVGQYGADRPDPTLGEPRHELIWWTAQKEMNAIGVHTGVGVIPPYTFDVTKAVSAAGAGDHTLRVVIDHGDDYWIFSAELLLG